MGSNLLFYTYLIVLLLIPIIILIKVVLYQRGYGHEEIENLPLYVHERNKCKSAIERRLFDSLINKGYYAKTQVSCGKYQIDIALPNYLIAIEFGGNPYQISPFQKAYDRRKLRYLRKQGWRIIRIRERSVYGDIGRIMRRIEKEVT